MRIFLCALLAGVTIVATPATQATPATADMATAFENTVVSRYPDGGWVKHWFNRDGTYRAEFSDGRRLAAQWSVRGERVCLTHIRPSMVIPRFCTPLVDAAIGDSWQSRDPLGRRVRNMMVEGR